MKIELWGIFYHPNSADPKKKVLTSLLTPNVRKLRRGKCQIKVVDKGSLVISVSHVLNILWLF